MLMTVWKRRISPFKGERNIRENLAERERQMMDGLWRPLYHPIWLRYYGVIMAVTRIFVLITTWTHYTSTFQDNETKNINEKKW